MAFPIPAFQFSVDWGGIQLAFSEVTGLNIEVQVIGYRDGLSPEYSTAKMPGFNKYGNVSLKRGVFTSDKEYYKWLNTVKMNKPEYRDGIVILLNEEHEPVITWKIINAWPVKITSPDMKASGNEVAIETLEFAHEGITIENG